MYYYNGNFLIVAYRELRRLEHDVIFEETQGTMSLFEILDMIKVEVSQFYGIEIVPYAVSVARLGLWLMDHIMNLEATSLFGAYYARLPLHNGGNVVNADALKVDWLTVFNDSQKIVYENLSEKDDDRWAELSKASDDIHFVRTNHFDFILGNPPFIGFQTMSADQKEVLSNLTKLYTKSKRIYFVSGWYFKAGEMIKDNPKLQVALVSTNSVVQGVQANDIWKPLFEQFSIKINFAHQTLCGTITESLYLWSLLALQNLTDLSKICLSMMTSKAIPSNLTEKISINIYYQHLLFLWRNKLSHFLTFLP